MLIIEVDGITHHYDGAMEKYNIRQKRLEGAGYTVLRFDESPSCWIWCLPLAGVPEGRGWKSPCSTIIWSTTLSVSGESPPRRKIINLHLKLMKLKPDTWFFICAVLAVISAIFSPVGYYRSFYSLYSGLFLIIIGLILMVWANITLIKHKTSIQPYQTPTALVTTGPFRFSRNPIYLCMAIILLGFILILAPLPGIIFPALFILIMDRLVIRGEESNLEKQFGSSYLNYKKKVRRWI